MAATEPEQNLLSYPKSRIKILLLENIHTVAVQRLKSEGFQVRSGEVISRNPSIHTARARARRLRRSRAL